MALGGRCPALKTQHSGHWLGAQVMPDPPRAQGGGSAPCVTCPEVGEEEVPLVGWGWKGPLPLGCLALAPKQAWALQSSSLAPDRSFSLYVL